MAGKKLTGRVWFRAILCAFVSVGIVVAAFTFGGGFLLPSLSSSHRLSLSSFCFFFFAVHHAAPHKGEKKHRRSLTPLPPRPTPPLSTSRADQFKHIAEKHDEKIDAYHRSVAAGGGIGASWSSGPTVGSFAGEEEPDEGSPNALEQADADEAENAEDAADGAAPTEEEEETPTADPEQQSASASASESSDPAAADAASDPALITNARCGGQPASLLPFASATRHHRRRTLFDEVDEVDVDATWPGAGAGARVDGNLTASIVVDAAAAMIDLAEVYTRHEQQREQRLQGMHPAASSRRRNLLHRTIGYTMGKAGCGKEMTVRVEHENDGAGPTPRRTVKLGEESLAACLQQPERCGAGSQEAGRSLPGLSALRKVPKVQLTGLLAKGKTFKSCAIVGNAGHLNTHEYGKYIDNHEAVVRFNILPVAGFEKHIGEVRLSHSPPGGGG